MRTFIFRFSESFEKSSENAFADLWLSSKLFFARNGEFGEVQLKPITRGQVMAQKAEKTDSRLGALAQALGGVEQEEYTTLLEDSQRLKNILSALGPQVAAGNGAVAATPAAPSSAGGQSLRKRNWKSLSKREQIEWLIDHLERKHREGGVLKNGDWETYVKASFGHYNAALGRSLRSAVARTSGKFRRHFVKKIKATCGADAPSFIARLEKV
jgi:hypothetical protein